MKKFKDYGCTTHMYAYLEVVVGSLSKPNWSLLHRKTAELSMYFCECSFVAIVDEMFSETLAHVNRLTERKILVEVMTTVAMLVGQCSGPNSICNTEIAFRMCDNLAVFAKYQCSIKTSLQVQSNMLAFMLARNYRNKQGVYLRQAIDHLELLADAFYFSSNSFMLAVTNYHLALAYYGLAKFCDQETYAKAQVYFQRAKNFFSQFKVRQPLPDASITNIISQLMTEVAEVTDCFEVQTQFVHTWSERPSEYLDKLRVTPVKSSEQPQMFSIKHTDDLDLSEKELECYIKTSVWSAPQIILLHINLLEVF
jgi:hypothetical protein